MLCWHARDLCLRYDITCCSRMKAPHLPFSCKFNDNKTLASYANGVYDYYDVEQIEEFVAFMGAYEIESMFKTFEDFDDSVYRPEIFAILRYCYENYEYNYNINAFIEKVSAVQEETNILQEAMEEEIDEIVSSLDEKMMRRVRNKRRKSGLITHVHLLMRVILQLIHCLIPLRAYRRMIAMIPLILLKYPFLMILLCLCPRCQYELCLWR